MFYGKWWHTVVLQKEIAMIVSDSSGFSNTGDKTCSNRLYCSDTAVMTTSAILLAVATAGLVVKELQLCRFADCHLVSVAQAVFQQVCICFMESGGTQSCKKK